MNAQEKWTDKVAALLRKAESTTSEEEAELFFAKAQELITKHGLDELAVQAAKNAGQSYDFGEVGKTIIKVSSSYSKQDALLVQAVAKANDCRILWDRHRHEVWLYGHDGDRTNVELLYTSLLLFLTRETLRYRKTTGLKGTPLYIAARSFREGFANRIEKRLQEMRNATIKQYVDEGNPLLPALASKKDAVEKAMAGYAGKAKRSHQKHNYAAAQAGHQAANRADLGGPRIGAPTKGALGR